MLYLPDLMDMHLFSQRVEDGYIRTQAHHDLPLTIHNYAERAAYERVWDEATRQCRGLVTGPDLEVVVLPLPKFFNYEEHLTMAELPDIPDEGFEVQEKLDGSLFLVRKHPIYGLVTASRGSFASEQAQKGRQLLIENYGWQYMQEDLTYIFEVIYPQNRIVVNYGDTEELVLLAVRNNITNQDLTISTVHRWADALGCRPPKYFTHIDQIHEAKQHIQDDEEGFVIRYDSGLRVKIKGDEYVRLHKIVTEMSPRMIWEWLREDRDFDDLLANVPDEFYDQVKKIAAELTAQHDAIIASAQAVADSVSELPTRKEQANTIVNSHYPGISFALLDEDTDRASDGTWKMIKPPFEPTEG